MLITTILVISYIISGIIIYGLVFNYLQTEFPLIAKENYKKDRFFSILFGLGGFLSLISFLISLVSFTDLKSNLKLKFK
jgi:hypothetical protein